MEDDNSKVSKLSILTVSFMVVGNLIGVGILALPVNTGLAGFIPSIISMLVFGGAMFFSAAVLAKEANHERTETFNYPSLYHNYLGVSGKWIAIGANLILLYGLLVAYITGGSSIIASLFNVPALFHKWIVLAFFMALAFIIITSVKLVEKYNALFVTIMFIAFSVIIFMGAKHIKIERLTYTDWKFLPCAIPIVVTAFHFHNIIPTICHSLKWKNSIVIKTIFIGMCIGFLMNMLWILIGVGALPIRGEQQSLLYAFEHDFPATVPLSKIISSSAFMGFTLIFSLMAIITSFLANGMGLLAFIKDLTANHFKKHNKALDVMLTFLPPLMISLIYPDIFLDAINVAGGFGIVILFGVLPSILAIFKTSGWRRKTAFVMLILFISALVFDSFQETGMFKIRPKTEYHTPNIKQERGNS